MTWSDDKVITIVGRMRKSSESVLLDERADEYASDRKMLITA